VSQRENSDVSNKQSPFRSSKTVLFHYSNEHIKYITDCVKLRCACFDYILKFDTDISIYIYSLKCDALHGCVRIPRCNIKFQVKNDRSELFNLFSILNSYRKSNFIFFEFVLLFSWIKRKLLDLKILDCPIMIIFFLPKKIVNKF
jgi:hypothetical protein